MIVVQRSLQRWNYQSECASEFVLCRKSLASVRVFVGLEVTVQAISAHVFKIMTPALPGSSLRFAA